MPTPPPLSPIPHHHQRQRRRQWKLPPRHGGMAAWRCHNTTHHYANHAAHRPLPVARSLLTPTPTAAAAAETATVATTAQHQWRPRGCVTTPPTTMPTTPSPVAPRP